MLEFTGILIYSLTNYLFFNLLSRIDFHTKDWHAYGSEVQDLDLNLYKLRNFSNGKLDQSGLNKMLSFC